LPRSGLRAAALSRAEAARSGGNDYLSGGEFLASGTAGETNCLILDVGLPGMSGPDLQQELKRLGLSIPIVFITAQGDAALRPRLVALGAVACLFKPFNDEALLDAINLALRMR